jgi:2-dehydropantoate 2-reductase
MRICILGAGAIGGLLAVRLGRVGHDLCVIARGAHLDAIRTNGLTLIGLDGAHENLRLRASSRMADFGPQDCVILAVKAHQVAAVVADLPVLFDDRTMVMSAQNGIPWWYFFGAEGPYKGRRLESVDPGGVISDRLPDWRVVGSVVYPAAEIVGPGVVRHVEGERFSLGEIDGSRTPRVEALSHALTDAGFKAPVAIDLRSELWMKLWGNMSFNPISALTHATLEDICRFPLARAVIVEMMREAQTIGERLGVRFRMSIDKRIAVAEAVGAHKTSMLQYVEAGRSLETEALIGAIIELAQITGAPAPATSSVYACVKLLEATLSARKGRLRIESS